ncbi:MAG: PDZ domain-containing protein, partial [Myxococcota bacterium]|nr:PDZ domain-containing protein [Myxococcota bacterium]
TSSVGGVLADSKGRVLALWASFLRGGSAEDTTSFFAGIPIQRIIDVLEPLRAGRPVGWRSIGAELRPASLADGRDHGLNEEWARRLEEHDPSERRVLFVASVGAGSPAASLLRGGDLLLSVGGEPVTRIHDVERAAQAETVTLRVMRGGEPVDVTLTPELLDGHGTRRALLWNGALLQEAPRSLATEFQLEQRGVYVAWRWFGSPANRHRLSATHRIIGVDGQETPNLDALLAVTRSVKDGESVRLDVLDLENKLDVITLERDLEFWPTVELRLEESGWKRLPLPSAQQAATEAPPGS